MKNNLKSLTAIIMTLIMLVNIFPISAFSAGNASMSLTASSVSGEAGDTVEVEISVSDNPGIASLKFDVEYADCLTLEGVTFNSAFGPYATTPPVYSNPQRITLISPFSECTVNGVLATLTFKIADDAPAGKYDISLSYIQGETYDSDFNDVVLHPVDGSVTVGAAASALSVETYLDCEYEVSGRVVTVSGDVACKVGYKSGVRYIALDALPNADGSYSFTAPDGVSEVLLVLKGDANLDGRVTAADIARINASKLGKTTITSEAIFAGDVDRNSAVNDSDIDTIKNAVLRISPLEW